MYLQNLGGEGGYLLSYLHYTIQHTFVEGYFILSLSSTHVPFSEGLLSEVPL